MNFCPEKPGSTVIIKTISALSRTFFILSSGVFGFIATAGSFQPTPSSAFGDFDAFMFKFKADGTTRLCGTYIGGDNVATQDTKIELERL